MYICGKHNRRCRYISILPAHNIAYLAKEYGTLIEDSYSNRDGATRFINPNPNVHPAQYLSDGDRSLKTVQYVQGFGERLHTVTMFTRSVFK